jgi:hypothetical protein
MNGDMGARLMRITTAAVALLLAGCSSAGAPPAIQTAAVLAYDPMKPTPEEQAQRDAIDKLKAVRKVALSAKQRHIIIAGIRERMVDPSSTKFGAIASGVDESGTTNFCVWVNSKNGYGGYAGAKPFAGKIVGKSVQDFDFNTYGYDLHSLCSQLGLDLEDLAKPI